MKKTSMKEARRLETKKQKLIRKYKPEKEDEVTKEIFVKIKNPFFISYPQGLQKTIEQKLKQIQSSLSFVWATGMSLV